jgi:hypothetical protein
VQYFKSPYNKEMTDSKDVASLKGIAVKLCKAMEMAKIQAVSEFYGFPDGTCGTATEVLLYAIKEELNITGYRVTGEIEGQSGKTITHAWASVEGLVIDITADQFSCSGLPKVFVGVQSSFHEQWEIIQRHAYDETAYPTDGRLYSALAKYF